MMDQEYDVALVEVAGKHFSEVDLAEGKVGWSKIPSLDQVKGRIHLSRQIREHKLVECSSSGDICCSLERDG